MPVDVPLPGPMTARFLRLYGRVWPALSQVMAVQATEQVLDSLLVNARDVIFIAVVVALYGFAGVCIGMFLVGALATLVDRYVIVARTSWTMPIMVAAIAWQESFVGHTMIQFVKTVALCIPVLIVLRLSLRKKGNHLVEQP